MANPGADMIGLHSLLQEQYETSVNLMASINDDLSSVGETLRALNRSFDSNKRSLNVTASALSSGLLNDLRQFLSERQMSMSETLLTLANGKTSLTRFGDGEFRAALSPFFRFSFQTNSPGLMQELRHILSTPVDGLMVGLPDTQPDDFWDAMWCQIWGQIKILLPEATSFGNSMVSRPIFFQLHGDEGVELWRQVWRGSDVCVITGRDSRFDYVHRLFDSAKSWSRLEAPSTQAYEQTEEILRKISKVDADTLLLSLGPAGTTIAAQAHLSGRRVIDIGHLSASFRNVFQDQSHPEHLPIQRS